MIRSDLWFLFLCAARTLALEWWIPIFIRPLEPRRTQSRRWWPGVLCTYELWRWIILSYLKLLISAHYFSQVLHKNSHCDVVFWFILCPLWRRSALERYALFNNISIRLCKKSYFSLIFSVWHGSCGFLPQQFIDNVSQICCHLWIGILLFF